VIAAISQVIVCSPAKRIRVLALILLAAISWGATAAVTHHHGIAARAGTLRNASNCQSVPPRVESSDSQSSNKKSTRDECLICQLHKNLFATVMGHALHETPALLMSSRASAPLISRQSQFTTSERGRAPPIIL
jgi:hypothetical protein